MKRSTLSILALSLFGFSALLFGSTDKSELNQRAIEIVKKFAGTLKPELKSALETSGPASAVEVCSIKAPAIAAALSAETGWEVRRVSLKPRNPSAAPDEWETASLNVLAQRQAANDGSDPLVISKIDEQEFRFMKAQPVEGVCLKCHGTDISPDVAKALQQFYPNDAGTGYALGEIRGAISLRKRIPSL